MNDDDLQLAFSEIFLGKEAHDFQIEVAGHLLNGKSVILQAPTGSGKTWTAHFPFLYARRNGLAFPRKCLYAVPLRVLATQFKEDTEKLVATWEEGMKPKIRLQTGEQQEDPTFEGDIIFTTIDQVLSSALGVPYSLGFRRANMNAGAVLSSFLVCDELHLFPIDQATGQGALATLIELLSTFRKTFPFLLMTATFSKEMLDTLKQELGVELVTVSEKELSRIGSQQKTRRYHVMKETALTASVVLQGHQARSIVICNQVERAIHLYENICQEVDSNPLHKGRTQVELLHARFIDEHRQEKEGTIRREFGEHQEGDHRQESLITVATQAIEVGLNITCERLHTELAPANAIIQRAGRCARYQGEVGDVFIYGFYAFPDEESKRAHLPYDAHLCDETWTAFSDSQYNGKALQFNDEQTIVSQVHNSADKKLLEKIIEDTRHQRWQAMREAMFQGETKNRPTLIREVDSRTLLIHGNPEQISDPYAWQGFSIYKGTLRGWLAKIQKAEGPQADWILRYPVEVKDESQESRKAPVYRWDNYVRYPDHIDVSPLFVVHPDLVSYDRKRGFRLMPAEAITDLTQFAPKPLKREQLPFETRYNLENYAEHISNMLDYYQHKSNLSPQIQLASQRLAQNWEYGLTTKEFERAVLLALALHDVGKLQVEWQHWSHAYQQAIGEYDFDPSMMIVHTHLKPKQYSRHREVEEEMKKAKIARPHHAAEGAYASWPIILQALEGNERLSRAVFTAIARHHAPFVESVNPYTLHPLSKEAIGEALRLIGISDQFAALIQMECKGLPKDGALQDQLISSGDPAQWLVYALIVRTLRLCDGHALEQEE